ncbi:QVPTGV class sortase B protein-sorting domain-containing protein [Rhizobium rhizogenes]|uniref:Uncharacterized protein n=1 Tax=Rhizobium rhizogenes TaxID=359 RepID=A0AA92C6W3_RHIRH|nr:hypothetical protein DC430_05660 [Rhizobium rhizogenes]PVE68278.1 hypothetical protein DC415_00555 [Agrobacterium tumefaciens]PVE78026.1 hypothetical protein DCP16_00555 [Sphingomonas sp. TPD3009]
MFFRPGTLAPFLALSPLLLGGILYGAKRYATG